MKITVGTESQSLTEILSAAQKTATRKARITGASAIKLQNLGAQDIYIETGADATVENSYKIVASTGVFDLVHDDLSDVNLIAGSENSDVRVLIAGS